MDYKTQIAIFEGFDTDVLEKEVNSFIDDKEVVSVNAQFIDITKSVEAVHGRVSKVITQKIITVVYIEPTAADMLEYGGC